MMHLLTALGSDLMRGAPISEVESGTFFIMMCLMLMILQWCCWKWCWDRDGAVRVIMARVVRRPRRVPLNQPQPPWGCFLTLCILIICLIIMMKTMMMMMALDMMHLMTAPGRGLMKERRMPSTRGGGLQINLAKEGKDKDNTTYKGKIHIQCNATHFWWKRKWCE